MCCLPFTSLFPRLDATVWLQRFIVYDRAYTFLYFKEFSKLFKKLFKNMCRHIPKSEVLKTVAFLSRPVHEINLSGSFRKTLMSAPIWICAIIHTSISVIMSTHPGGDNFSPLLPSFVTKPSSYN